MFRVKELRPVHIPADGPRLPFHGEIVKSLGEVPCGQCDRPLGLLVGQAVVQGAVVLIRLVPQHLHDVELPADRPLAVLVLVGGHQPEGGQESPALWDSQPGLENAVGKVPLPLGGDAPGGVEHAPVLLHPLHRPEEQLSILYPDDLIVIHILLKLFVDPARRMEFHVPAGPVESRAVEIILKHQVIAFVRQCFLHGVHPLSASKIRDR